MSRRVLIIDADADARAVVAALVRDVLPGARISEVADAIGLTGALDLPAVEVAIVARELQWADGLDLVKLLRKRHPGCASVLLGAMPEQQDDPDAQPDAHLGRGTAGLARLGTVLLRVLQRHDGARDGIAAGAAWDALPVAMLDLSSDERVLSANGRAADLFGHQRGMSLVGRNLSELVTVGDGDGRAAAGAAAAAAAGIAVLARPQDGAPIRCRLVARARTRDGLLTGFTAALVPESAAPGGDVDDLLYAVSHDLQQPLATTTRSAQMLSDRLTSQGRLGGQEERMLRRILSGAERMDTLVSGLLDYVRTGQNPVQRERVDLGAVCDAVVRGMQAQLEETGGVVRWQGLPELDVSRAEVTRLMENLIGNAIKFHGSAPPVVEIACVERDDCWLLSVRDNGIGIDQTNEARIFQPFQRLHTESEYPGTGIGLAICRQICERHGGRIWFTANPEAGTTFFATFAKDE